jgi:anti-sigma B factor antagonist
MMLLPAAEQARFTDEAEVTTLILEGELGLREMAQVGEELFRLAHRGRRRIVLDLSDVNHVDFRALRPLVARANLLRRAGGDIKVCGLSGYVAHIFRAAGAHDAFEFFVHPDNARAAFGLSRLAG